MIGKLTQHAAVFTVVLNIWTASSAADDRLVKIGVLADMAGPFAAVAGPGSVQAASMAAQDLKEELRDFKVEILSGDHQNKPDIGANIVRRWFDTESVDAIADIPVSSVALAVQSLARDHKKIVLFSSAGSPRLSNEECSPYSVQWTFDTNAVGRAAAKAMIDEGGSNWFFLTADYVFGHDLQASAQRVVEQSRGKVLGAVRHPINSSDFASFILQAQASGAKVVGVASTGPDAQKVVTGMAEFGLLASGQKAASLLMYDSDVRAVGLKVAQGLYLASAFYWDLNDGTRAFAKRYFERMKAMPNMLQAGVYSSVRHYLLGVAATGSKDSAKVMEWMRVHPVNDFFATNGHVREDGLMVHDMYLMQVKSPEESKGDWDILKLVRRIPGDSAFTPLAESKCKFVKH